MNIAGIQVSLGTQQGSRVRIPRKAVAVLAELSPYVTGTLFREGGDRAEGLSQKTCPRTSHKEASPALGGCSFSRRKLLRALSLYPFGYSFFVARILVFFTSVSYRAGRLPPRGPAGRTAGSWPAA